jgi:hypothetical protein
LLESHNEIVQSAGRQVVSFGRSRKRVALSRDLHGLLLERYTQLGYRVTVEESDRGPDVLSVPETATFHSMMEFGPYRFDAAGYKHDLDFAKIAPTRHALIPDQRHSTLQLSPDRKRYDCDHHMSPTGILTHIFEHATQDHHNQFLSPRLWGVFKGFKIADQHGDLYGYRNYPGLNM